jgi:hypothetical protein
MARALQHTGQLDTFNLLHSIDNALPHPSRCTANRYFNHFIHLLF